VLDTLALGIQATYERTSSPDAQDLSKPGAMARRGTPLTPS